ncbi:rhodanese-like domain-containing protein [Lacihabitans sp. LS3-19]|uniref:rhodanese-like domain-containing protein n=1 Tax=Lacihabitans sp. LS3-19 TaxID=2487335 RepID=UPI0020CE402A|nr:rhodanese-like domain-containing protein [Lacihabitans sp. LS3-19]MCP9768564.1 rhodanese-like domain-containing protein [Lacihabitans sp. LS3-19]
METQSLVKEICPTSTQKWVKDGAVLVDVREKDEVEKSTFDVPNILYIPLSEFEDRFSEIPRNKNVVVVCQNGGRSLRAAGFLVNHGYENVVNMQHGMNRWVERGFPVKGIVNISPKNTSCCSSSGCC